MAEAILFFVGAIIGLGGGGFLGYKYGQMVERKARAAVDVFRTP